MYGNKYFQIARNIVRFVSRNELLQSTENMIFGLYCLINIKTQQTKTFFNIFYLYTKKRKI